MEVRLYEEYISYLNDRDFFKKVRDRIFLNIPILFFRCLRPQLQAASRLPNAPNWIAKPAQKTRPAAFSNSWMPAETIRRKLWAFFSSNYPFVIVLSTELCPMFRLDEFRQVSGVRKPVLCKMDLWKSGKCVSYESLQTRIFECALGLLKSRKSGLRKCMGLWKSQNSRLGKRLGLRKSREWGLCDVNELNLMSGSKCKLWLIVALISLLTKK